MESRLTQFMADSGNRPYRELVEHHLRKQSTEALRVASLGEGQALPESMQADSMDYIDKVNEKVGVNQLFWREATCRHAHDTFISVAIDVFGDSKQMSRTSKDEFWLVDEELGFTLFQIATLSFAYSASSQRAMRKFIGIRKGIFG